MTTTACLPECERNCWTGQDKHAFGCPVAAMFGAAEQAYFGPSAPQAKVVCICEQPRTAAGDGPKQGCDCPMTPPPFPRKAHSESCPERPDRLTVDGEPKHGSEGAVIAKAAKPAPAPESAPLMGIDAQKWAEEFMRIWSGRWSEVDEALMIGWFANAIMRGYDEGQSRLRKELQSANPTPAPEPKQGSEEPFDWDAAKASSESWAKGRPLPHDLKCTPAQETLGRAYVALRAEVENWRNESLPTKLIDALRTENERLYGKVQGHGLVLAERDALRAELAAARDEIARITALYDERGELAEHHKAAFHAEKARADKAEEIILLCGLPGWEERLISARKGILATRARQEQKEGGR